MGEKRKKKSVWETYFMAQLMSTSTASSASTRLRAEACDKGHVPAQLPLPKVVTLVCNLVCAVGFWQHSSAQGPPRANHRNLYQAHFCLQEFRNNNVSLRESFGENLLPFPFCFHFLLGRHIWVLSKSRCLAVMNIEVTCHALKLQLGTQDQKVKWHFGKKRTQIFYLDI